MDPETNRDIDLRSLFLGPKGENADVFERLLLEAFRDHVFWRRNFHPSDGFSIRESERHAPEYERSLQLLKQELLGLLAELKAGVPFFSPRYIGHMCADLTMASLIGYFAAMLYNPNNVSMEASPVTSRLEIEVAEQLARMIGFSSETQWGHLTSGGTVANFEALWLAHNVMYLPIAIRWTAADLGLDAGSVRLVSGEWAELSELDLWTLLNIPPSSALDLADRFQRAASDRRDLHQLIVAHSLEGVGSQAFGYRLSREFPSVLPPAVVLVPSTAHYSWEKTCRALGVGSRQLVHIPVDSRFRLDTDALGQILEELATSRQPVLGCVAVLGTTEEGAIDRIDRVVALRARAGRDFGMSFHLHVDAAWGGYALSVLKDRHGRNRPFEQVLRAHAPETWPSEGIYRSLAAVAEADSVTIDPHKLGYVPYPAGAVSFADRRARHLIAVDAPYVFHREGSEAANIGRYILEGSKPGAAAAGVWLSHQVLPLDGDGYGRLIGQTARGARVLYRRLSAGDWHPFELLLLPEPDLNIVCFAVNHPKLETLAQTNQLVTRVHQRMSIGEQRAPREVDFFLTRTTLRAGEYGDSVVPLVERLGFDRSAYRDVGGVAVLRCTVMDPFLGQPQGHVDFVEGFACCLRQVLDSSLEGLLAEERA